MYWRSTEFIVTARKDTFFLISTTGVVLGSYERRAYSDEDDLWVTQATVEGGRLIERTTIEGPYHPLIVNEEKVLATGLVAVDDDETTRLVEKVLGAAAGAARRENLARERAAEARVDAVEGARKDLGCGPLVARAQDALQVEIKRGHDERAPKMMRTLIKLVEAKVTLEVIEGYARGCLAACSEDSPPLPSLPAKTAPNPDLANELREQAKDLLIHSEFKESFDSHAGAAALWRAAKALEWAAEQLS